MVHPLKVEGAGSTYLKWSSDNPMHPHHLVSRFFGFGFRSLQDETVLFKETAANIHKFGFAMTLVSIWIWDPIHFGFEMTVVGFRLVQHETVLFKETTATCPSLDLKWPMGSIGYRYGIVSIWIWNDCCWISSCHHLQNWCQNESGHNIVILSETTIS